MAKLQFDYDVEFADGTLERVVADQRDLARWEVQDFAAPGRMHLQVRFLAWSALKREQRYAGAFDKFNEKDCVTVTAAEMPDEEEGEQGLDPGRPARAASS